VLPIARGAEAVGRTMQLRIVAADRDHADPSAVALTVTPSAAALRPLSPVHIRGRRLGDGVHITWRRRARLPASPTVAMPLEEPEEAYVLDILSGGSVVRSMNVGAPSAIYATADEAADFGGVQTGLTVRVAQISATVGRGISAETIINQLA
jgi:hypothetical protein